MRHYVGTTGIVLHDKPQATTLCVHRQLAQWVSSTVSPDQPDVSCMTIADALQKDGICQGSGESFLSSLKTAVATLKVTQQYGPNEGHTAGPSLTILCSL